MSADRLRSPLRAARLLVGLVLFGYRGSRRHLWERLKGLSRDVETVAAALEPCNQCGLTRGSYVVAVAREKIPACELPGCANRNRTGNEQLASDLHALWKPHVGSPYQEAGRDFEEA